VKAEFSCRRQADVVDSRRWFVIHSHQHVAETSTWLLRMSTIRHIPHPYDTEFDDHRMRLVSFTSKALFCWSQGRSLGVCVIESNRSLDVGS